MGAVGEHEEAMDSKTCGVPSPIIEPVEQPKDVTQEGSPTEEKAVQRDTEQSKVTKICTDSRRGLSDTAFSLMDLPEELLIMILQYIPLRLLIAMVSLVSKEFYRICHLPTFWRRLSLSNVWCVTYTQNTLAQIFHRHGENFKYVYFGGNYKVSLTNIHVVIALSHCTNLSSLDIGTNGFLTGLAFLKSMPKLKRLILDYCIEIDAYDFLLYLRCCPLLEELSMYRCTQLTHDIVTAILMDSDLRKINLERALVFDPENLQQLLDVSNVTSFAGTPDESNRQLWRFVLAKYHNVKFNKAIADMILE